MYPYYTSTRMQIFNEKLRNLPQELKIRIYGFIHIEDRIKILKEQYYDKLVSNNSIWYQYVEHMDEQLLENFNSTSRAFPHTLGYSPKSVNDYSMIPDDESILYNEYSIFPKLSGTIYYSRNKTRNIRHPFYDDIDHFIRRKINWHSKSRLLRISKRRNPPKTYKKYLINNRTDIMKNFENQFDLLCWNTYDTAFDRVYSEEVFNHLLTVIICINQPNIIHQLENSKISLELKAKLLAEKKELEEKRKREEHMKKVIEHNRMRDEISLMIEEDRSSHKYEKDIKIKNKRILKQTEKDNARKHREKLARQKEQDRMLATTTKLMQSMFKVKPIQKPKIDRVAQKALKEKLKRDKEYDRVDKEVLKAMNNIFKITKRRIKQKL